MKKYRLIIYENKEQGQVTTNLEDLQKIAINVEKSNSKKKCEIIEVKTVDQCIKQIDNRIKELRNQRHFCAKHKMEYEQYFLNKLIQELDDLRFKLDFE